MQLKQLLDFSVAVVQMKPQPGKVAENLDMIRGYIRRAKKLGAKMVVFPELATTNYMLGDRWEDKSFMEEVIEANDEIRKESKGIVVIWGSVRVDKDRLGEDGRWRKYNAAMIAQDGKWVSNGVLCGWVPKTNEPKYRIFDDERHFFSAPKLMQEMAKSRGFQFLWQLLRPFVVTINSRKIKLGLTVCEDLWDDEYNHKPAKEYGMQGVDLIVNVSQSPWTTDKWKARDKMLHRRALVAKCPILYVNSVGLQNNAKNLIWFDGGSCFVNAAGKICWMGPLNRDGQTLINPSELLIKPVPYTHPEGIEEKHAATIAAMREFYKNTARVIIGLSGGIDSAVSLAMHDEALGPDKVLAINMPTEFNSATTKNLAAQIARNFAVEYRVVPIQEQYEARLELLLQAGYENPSDFDRQNVQARIRGQVLADITACESSRLRGRCMFTCNGNKTEVALNYFTLYGDGAGGSAFFADYWKGEMYELGRFINKRAGIDLIPEGVFKVVPSAELSKTQNVDEGKGDPIFYPFHDKLLRAFVEKRQDPTDILKFLNAGTIEEELGCVPGTLGKYFVTRRALIESIEWAWLQYSYEGKRHMLPPGFITSRRAFGFDRRETIADGYFTTKYKRLKSEFLEEAA
jgi:NAD+ synthase (glutamine-hydrolysing)